MSRKPRETVGDHAGQRSPETGRGRRTRRIALLGTTALSGGVRFAIWGLTGLLMMVAGPRAVALPLGGRVSAGQAGITSTPNAVTIDQTSQNAVINWQSFSIGKNQSATFAQPNSSAVTLNRDIGANPSTILGRLSANGQVFVVNPNGVLFGKGAQVNVGGGLVASTLDIEDGDVMARRYHFAGSSRNAVINRGSITAGHGYVALLGANVDNEGVINARLGTVALAGGSAVTLDVAGNGLLNVAVDKGAVRALVANGGLIQARGGHVVLTAQAAGQLLKTVVNNTGIIDAQSVRSVNGSIQLLGDEESGTVNVSGTLNASAPVGGNGGTIETSAAQVNIAPHARITTAARHGRTGTWTIDPVDFTVGPTGNISGPTLSALLVTNSVVISTLPGASTTTTPGTPPTTGLTSTIVGNGDITIDDAVAWTASTSPTTLTLDAFRDVNVNMPVTATNGNFVTCCGRDVNVNAAITTVNGSISLNGGRNVTLASTGALTTTDGNILLCAGLDITVDGKITLTRGTTVPTESLGLNPGLTLLAGTGGTGPGVGGGTVIFGAEAPPITVTGPNAPVLIDYNPVSYSAPTDFSTNFVLTGGSTVTEQMLVFPGAQKVADGTGDVVLSGFNSTATSGLPTGVTLVAGPDAVATFDSTAPGTGIGVTYSGYSLAGTNAAKYALATNCCVPGSRTTGTILASLPTPDTDAHAYTHADADAHADTHADSHAHADTNAHADTHADAHAHTHADTNAHTDAHTHAHADTHAHTHADTNAHAHTHADAHADTNAHTHTHADTDAHANTHTDAHADTNAHTHADTDAHAHANTHTNADAHPDAYAYPDTDTDADDGRSRPAADHPDPDLGGAGDLPSVARVGLRLTAGQSAGRACRAGRAGSGRPARASPQAGSLLRHEQHAVQTGDVGLDDRPRRTGGTDVDAGVGGRRLACHPRSTAGRRFSRRGRFAAGAADGGLGGGDEQQWRAAVRDRRQGQSDRVHLRRDGAVARVHAGADGYGPRRWQRGGHRHEEVVGDRAGRADNARGPVRGRSRPRLRA